MWLRPLQSVLEGLLVHLGLENGKLELQKHTTWSSFVPGMVYKEKPYRVKMWVAVGSSQVESSLVPMGEGKGRQKQLNFSSYGFGGKEVKLLDVSALDSNHGSQWHNHPGCHRSIHSLRR